MDGIHQRHHDVLRGQRFRKSAKQSARLPAELSGQSLKDGEHFQHDVT